MTAAQRDYLQRKRIDPFTIEWRDARDFGVQDWGRTEAARLPDGRILLANGQPVTAESNQDSVQKEGA